MSRHEPPTPSDGNARLAQRLALLERKLAELEQAMPLQALSSGKAPLGFQFGKFTIAVTGIVGGTAAEVTLPVAWQNEHLHFIATPHPTTSNNQSFIQNSGPYDGTGKASLSKGLVSVHSETSQNMDIYWVSIGR